MIIPNVFDLADQALADFNAECTSIASDLSGRGLACTPANVARAVQIGNLLPLAAQARGSTPSKAVKLLADNVAACTLLSLGVEALGVDDPTPEQITGYVSSLEAALAGATHSSRKTRPFR